MKQFCGEAAAEHMRGGKVGCRAHGQILAGDTASLWHCLAGGAVPRVFFDRCLLLPCRYNIVNKRLPGWQDPPTRDAIQVRPHTSWHINWDTFGAARIAVAGCAHLWHVACALKWPAEARLGPASRTELLPGLLHISMQCWMCCGQQRHQLCP
jgi:hypothetical protein